MNLIKQRYDTEQKYYISTDNSLLNTKTIWVLLKDKFWTKDIPIKNIERFIKYSLCFGAYNRNTNEQVGFARVISDYTSYAYICDVVVDSAHQRQGIGTLLINNIFRYKELQGLKTWSLRTTKEACNISKAKGFKIASEPNTILEIDDLNFYVSANLSDGVSSKHSQKYNA